MLLGAVPPLFIPSKEQHTHTVIFIHGRGGEAQEMLQIIFNLKTSDNEVLPSLFPNIRWVFPSGQTLPHPVTGKNRITWFGGPEDGPYTKNNPPTYNEKNTADSLKVLTQLLHNELTLLNGNRENLLIAGFGQGMAIALLEMLVFSHNDSQGAMQPYGGFIGISGFLPGADAALQLAEDIKADTALSEDERVNKIRTMIPHMLTEPFHAFDVKPSDEVAGDLAATPTLIMHGWNDRLISTDLGKDAVLCLMELGVNVECVEFTGKNANGHEFNSEALESFVDFLRKFLGQCPDDPFDL